ncbi:alpha-2-macroglobulin family protein [Flexibacter flexilis]|nr:alpha-2-macroglobulin family protein [Flexibacter flexilis]
MKNTSYESLWAETDKLMGKGLPESARKKVEEIERKAIAEKNEVQQIKVLFYLASISASKDEDYEASNIIALEQQLQNKKISVAKSGVLHSVLGQYYQQYLDNNRWRIYEMSAPKDVELKGKVPTIETLATLNINQLSEIIITHYEQSMQNAKQLQQLPMAQFETLTTGGKQNRHLYPTLFDILAMRALDALNNDELFNTRPHEQFYINNPAYFGLAKEFVKLNIGTPDSLSVKWRMLRTYQQLAAFHLQDPKNDALINLEKKRIEFVLNNYTDSNTKTELYEKSLLAAADTYKNNEQVTEFLATVAQQRQAAGKPHEAIKIAQQGISLYPKSRGAALCQNIINAIQQPELSVTNLNITPSGLPQLALLSYRNLKSTRLSIYKISGNDYKWFKDYHYYNNKEHLSKILDLLEKKKPVNEQVVNLPDSNDYKTHSTEAKIPALDLGYYIIAVANDADLSKAQQLQLDAFQVSDLSFFVRNQEKEIRVLHRETGKPIAGVKVMAEYKYYDSHTGKEVVRETKYLTTSADGRANVPPMQNHHIAISLQSNHDTLSNCTSFGGDIHKPQPPQTQTQMFLFADRAIYRPTQTVYFKGIMIEKGLRDKAKVLADKEIWIKLLDPNDEEVFSKSYKTNQYGSLSGSVALPSGVLNGSFRLVANHAETDEYRWNYGSLAELNIQVEEYKRPKFEATFEPITGSFRLGDTISVTGVAKAFAGYGLDGAKVVLSIERQAYKPIYWWCWWVPPASKTSTVVLNQTLKTDQNGKFVVRFPALPDLAESDGTEFIYNIKADVIDQNGETHTANTSVQVGKTSLRLTANIGEEVNKEQKINLTVSSTNTVGQAVGAQVTARLYRVQTGTKATHSRYWTLPDAPTISDSDFAKDFPSDAPYHLQEPKTLLQTISFDTKTTTALTFKDLEKLPVGVYWVELETKDQHQTPVKAEYMFKLIAPKGKEIAKPLVFEAKLLRSSVEPLENAEILVVSSEKDFVVLYEVEHEGRIISSEQLTLNAEQRVLSLPIKEEYRGNVGIHLTAVRHNHTYSQTLTVYVPYTNKDLKISFETFRSKLLPNEKETWKLKISGYKSEKVAAEMLATLYDASLDAFAPNSFYMSVFNSYYPYLNWGGNTTFAQALNSYRWPATHYERYTSDDSYEDFRIHVPRRYRYGAVRKGMAPTAAYESMSDASVEMKTAAAPAPAMKAKKVAEQTLMAGNIAKEEAADTDNSVAPPKPQAQAAAPLEVKARSNFNETAFFLPHLQTNDKGEILVNFTIPESLTRWKMLGLAHTKDVSFGTVTNELVTQKTLMVVPNMPRFLRESDTIFLSTKIKNLSDKALQGKVQLQLFDALTQKSIDEQLGNKANTFDFSCPAAESSTATWKIIVPAGLEAVQYKIVAQAGTYSDGEEAVLPVLTNRILVTEALPLPIRGKQTKTFELEKLTKKASPTARNHSLTLEFTQNPAWYAVQALPYLMEYPYECAEQTFSRYYANSLAAHIVGSNPKIKAVFEQWKQSDSSAFLSNLQKNQELKSLLLQETPWVLQAKNESENKRRIAFLFDMIKMGEGLDAAIAKLEQMQMASGAFPWFKGMNENPYITQYIVAGIGHLQQLGVISIEKDARIAAIAEKAIAYLDNKMREDYEYLKKLHKVNLKEQHVGGLHIHYLYTRSFFKQEMEARNREAFSYYLGQSKKYWLSQPLYTQGLAALALHRYNEKETAKSIVASLSEKALHSEEMGMYWRANSGYFWYEAPIERQAIMIEVFDEVAQNAKAVEDLKVWLLKNKQTTNWETTKATAEACYALLLRGGNWLTDTQPIEISVGSQKIDLSKIKQEAGTGYFKTTFEAEQIKPEMGRVTVTKRDEGVAWGALYWQYFEQLDHITKAENNPLVIRKKLYKKQAGARGTELLPITTQTLEVGDMVQVRVEITTDRDLEYVHLKDLRASGFEPAETLSGYEWRNGLGYYQSIKDASANFFIGYLPKGTFVFEYDLRVAQAGSFSNGITSIQCMYAPEFTTHSEGIRVNIK